MRSDSGFRREGFDVCGPDAAKLVKAPTAAPGAKEGAPEALCNRCGKLIWRGESDASRVNRDQICQCDAAAGKLAPGEAVGSTVKYLDAETFRNGGYLQEANRALFPAAASCTSPALELVFEPMSEASEKTTIWESTFDCDGNCGATITLASHDENANVAIALPSLGWVVVAEDEAYCPFCRKVAELISKASAKKRRRRA